MTKEEELHWLSSHNAIKHRRPYKPHEMFGRARKQRACPYFNPKQGLDIGASTVPKLGLFQRERSTSYSRQVCAHILVCPRLRSLCIIQNSKPTPGIPADT